jgi:hypothetical protein
MRATGVQAIALAVNATFGSSMRTISLNASSRPLRAYVKNTTAEFATVMGLRMKSGRYFSAEEVSAGARVVVIDETIARAFWGADDPTGEPAGRLHASLAEATVVGVAVNVIPHSLEDLGRSVSALYIPLRSSELRAASLFFRSDASVPSTMGTAQATLRQLFPDDAPGVRRLSDGVAGARQRALIPARIAWLAGAAVVLLAAIGLGGVTATLVRQRGREFAIHLAMGASPGMVRWLIIRRGLRPVLGGIAVGLMAAIPVGASMGVLLYGVSPFDPVTLVASICVLLFGATFSMIGPARRAGRIAPIDALREGS